jgi:hypothetical protein
MRSLGVAMASSGEPDENFVTFAGHPERLHAKLPVDPEADEAVGALERRTPSDEQVSTIRSIIRETSQQEARRAALTWHVIEERRYADMHRRWTRRMQRAQSGGRLRGEPNGTTFPPVGDQNEGHP